MEPTGIQNVKEVVVLVEKGLGEVNKIIKSGKADVSQVFGLVFALASEAQAALKDIKLAPGELADLDRAEFDELMAAGGSNIAYTLVRTLANALKK